MKKLITFPDKILAHFFMFLLRGYQKIFSPDHSKTGKGFPFCGCRFFPSCSNYALLVLKESGFILGLGKILWRVLRCNPWNGGGVDFPSEETEKYFRQQNHCEKKDEQ